jgi:uncharacterized protein YkwD
MSLTLGLLLVLLLLPTQGQAPEKAKPPTKVEQEIIKLTNDARAKEKKPALTVNDLLMKAARQHAENMARLGQLTHVIDNKTPADRVKELGYEYAAVAENIAAGQRTPAEVLATWLNSEAHRTNILGEDYAEIGVAQVKSADGVLYYVQVFGKKQ